MKRILLTLVVATIGMLSGCEHVPFTPEKIVIFSVPAGFSGPIVFSLYPAYGDMPTIRGHDVIYSIPPSGVVRFRSMDPSNGALWKNYSVRYPDGKSVRSYGDGDVIQTEDSYLFHLGGHHFQGRSQELFLVATVAERLEFQKRQLTRHAEIEESSAIWREMHDAKR